MDDCIFDKIIKGEVPAEKVWENENFLAFLSIAPINPGHTLVIPKQHIDYFFDMDDKILGEIMVVCKPIAKAIKKAFNPKLGRIGVMISGSGVPHVHVHLIPMNDEKDLTFERQKPDTSKEELKENAEKIRENLI
ncbi:MAG: HIT family protein [Candidatus Daviesbacteria bacterium]|nr:HIT family protein [Candidatus Daviesbacteria bacterium]